LEDYFEGRDEGKRIYNRVGRGGGSKTIRIPGSWGRRGSGENRRGEKKKERKKSREKGTKRKGR